MATLDTGTFTRRRAIAGALGAAAGGAAFALATPARALAADGDPVKLGEGNTATATTTIACTGAHAIHATTDSGDALRGVSSGPNASGAFGTGVTPTSYGVFGFQATNLGRAALGAPSAALWASQYGAPWALRVEGKVSLTRSGRAVVRATRSFVDVAVPGGLAGAPLGFATLTTYRSGTWVVAVRPNIPSAGRIRINLNRAVAHDTKVAWLVLG